MLCMAQTDPRAKLVESALTRLGLSNRWIASRLDVSHVTIGKWLSGEARPRDMSVWQRMLDVLRQYESEGMSSGTLELKRAGIRTIPVYPGISAGGLNSVFADVEMLEVKDWGNGRDRWARIVDGYSMSPLLEPGDIVIFEEREPEPWHVVHAFDDGEDCVKVLRRSGTTVELVPVNPDYSVIDGRRMNVKGVAVGRIRKGPHDETYTADYPHGMRYRPDSAP